MNAFSIAERAFLGASAALALLSLPGLWRRHEGALWATARILVGVGLLGAALFLSCLAGLTLLAAGAGGDPYARTVVLALFRGQYAWTYHTFLLGLLCAQLLWVPEVRENPRRCLGVALVCLAAALSNEAALWAWGSR